MPASRISSSVEEMVVAPVMMLLVPIVRLPARVAAPISRVPAAAEIVWVPEPLKVMSAPAAEKARLPVSRVRESAVRASWISTVPPALIVRVAPSAVIESPLTASVPARVKLPAFERLKTSVPSDCSKITRLLVWVALPWTKNWTWSSSPSIASLEERSELLPMVTVSPEVVRETRPAV